MASISEFLKYEDFAKEKGAVNAKIIPASAVIVDNRIRLKCRFGCPFYFTHWMCPRQHDITPWIFKERFLNCYDWALIIHAYTYEDNQRIAFEVERKAFLDGYVLAFSIANCTLCEPCKYPEPCPHPEKARPSPSSLGINIFETVKKQGFYIETLKKKTEEQNWYSIVLID